jgi:hypothetical protein
MLLLIVKVLSYVFLVVGALIVFDAISASSRNDPSASGCAAVGGAFGVILIGIWLVLFLWLP